MIISFSRREVWYALRRGRGAQRFEAQRLRARVGLTVRRDLRRAAAVAERRDQRHRRRSSARRDADLYRADVAVVAARHEPHPH